MLKLNPETYRWCLREIEFGPDYQFWLIGQQIKNTCLKWLRLRKSSRLCVCVEHYVALLPYKSKHWVTCHQPQMLEDVILLMEAYMLAEAGVYL